MLTFIYHRLEPSAPNAVTGGRRVPKEAPEIFALPAFTEINAPDILAADLAFEQFTGINPVRYKGHTPPITCRVLPSPNEK